MKTDNEIIAEFMGFVPVVGTRPGSRWSHPDLGGVYGDGAQKMKYDTSWDWLIPVVEKIREIIMDKKSKSTDLNLEEMEYYDNIVDQGLFWTNIKATHGHVIAFIKWYNEVDKTKTK